MSVLNDHKNVFVVVPAFNEAEVLASVVDSLLAKNFTVVVVDDGSEISQINFLQTRPVHFLRHPVNLGQGAAIQTGIEYALKNNAHFIVTFDADGQHDVNDIEKLLSPLINDIADVSLGSRFKGSLTGPVPASRKMILKCARWVNYLVTGLLLTDAHNGLRAMNRKAAAAIKITQNRMAHATEFLSEIKRKNLRFVEIPVTILYTEYSKRKGQSAWGSFRIFIDLMVEKIFK